MEDKQRLLNKRRKDVRRVLWRWGDTMRLCKRKMDEIRALQAMIDDVRQKSPAPPDGMPRASGICDPTADSAARVEEIISSFSEGIDIIQESVDKAMALKHRIDELLEDLPPEHRKILEYKYIEGYSCMLIGFKLNRDESGVRGIERRAVDALLPYILIE